MTTIFFGVPSASGSSSDSSTGIQKRRSNSPMPVPAPLSVRNLLSSARSMGDLRILVLVLVKIGAGATARQRSSIPGWVRRNRNPFIFDTADQASSIHRTKLHRPLALHCHARSGPCMRPVVPHRAVLGAAVVPECDSVFGPAEAALE